MPQSRTQENQKNSPAIVAIPLKTITGQELMNNHYEPLRWVVPGLLPEGLTLLVGAPKLGKSWLALRLCHTVACGGVSINHQSVEQGSVLYLALEDSERRLQERLNIMQVGDRADLDQLHFSNEISRSDQGGLEQIKTFLDENPACKLVIVDTLQRFRAQAHRGPETYATDYDALIPLQKLAQERRIAIVLVHHTRKMDAKDPYDKISGTNALMGAVDTIWLLERGRGESEGKLNITGRDLDEQDLVLQFDKNTCQWSVLGNTCEIAATTQELEVIELLAQYQQPLTPAQIAQALGIKSSAAKRRLERLLKKNKIKKVGHGQYTCLDRDSSKSYSEPESHNEGVTPESQEAQ